MNLIERYVAEVGRHLPPKGRADIQAEIRSTLEDMLDDRSRRLGRPVDEAMTLAVLKEYGSPEKVALSYTGPQYLIGPRLFPLFWLITRIVITVVFFVSLAAFVFSFATGGASGAAFVRGLGQFLLQFIGGAISIFGNIAVVFAILERVLPDGKAAVGRGGLTVGLVQEEEKWDPAELAKEPDPDRIGMAGTIVGILFTVAALVVLNLYPDVIGLGFVSDGRWHFVPVLSQAFFAYLPWINLLGALRILFNLWQLRRRTWTPATRVLDILLEIGAIALLTVMLRGPALLDLSLERFAGTPLAAAPEALQLFQAVPALVLAIALVVSVVEVVSSLVNLIRRALNK